MDYKETLNLPSTSFPMKANLSRREPEILSYWKEIDLYKLLKKGRPYEKGRFVLHDGPPYANGHIHLGHTVNKVLKDIIVKSMTMSGYKSPYVPGWDCHGLPIEHNVEKELGPRKMEIGQLEMREKCRDYAKRFVSVQRDEFMRLGIIGDWEDPYLTIANEYEAAISRTFCDIFLLGLVKKRKKPVYWCPSCVTALAEAEVEYIDHSSPSITVKFPASQDLKAFVQERFGIQGDSLFVLIWTTTPWTLPANLAVAFHPDFDYVIAETGEELWIVAEERLFPLLAEFDMDQGDVRVIGRFRGSDVEGLHALHPFLDRESLLVNAYYVTLDTGTGCVHTAPGHGEDDYETGLRYNLEIYSPVDERGCFTEEVPQFSGRNIFDANNDIVELLRSRNALVHCSTIQHSYPHCWRCKSPIIFRATSQWFISMDEKDLRERALKAIEGVRWIPEWGKDRIRGMVESRPDWCISRQRAWGVPITVFLCEACGTPYLSQGVAERIVNIFKEEGSDAWFKRPVLDFLGTDVVCPSCGNAAFKKEKDILDVWFDSGVSHRAVLEERPELGIPADLYLEGSDQHRGWFQSSLLTSVAIKGVAPYRAVLTHGFVVDGKGKKMSKSVGNVIAPEKIIKRYGAEILRLWVSAEDYKDDIKISDEILRRLTEAYRKIRNTIRYLLGNLSDFDPIKDPVDFNDLESLDRWALMRHQGVVEKVKKAYAQYRFHVVYHRLYQFCTVDLSALYLDILKDRLYCELKGGKKRRSAQTVLYIIAADLLRLLSPILSFTAEEAWRHLPKKMPGVGSIFLEDFPEGRYIEEDTAFMERWERLLALRGEITKSLEIARKERIIGSALDARVELMVGDALLRGFVQENLDELRTIAIVSQLCLDHGGSSGPGLTWHSDEIEGFTVRVTKALGKKCARCWTWNEEVGSDVTFKDVCPRCAGVLRAMGPEPPG